VLRTEVIQATVLIAGAATVAWSAFARAGGWHAVMAGVDPAALSLIRPIGDPVVPWPGLLLGVPLLGFYYWCTNQVMVQRILSARDLEHARAGALLAALLKLPVLFLMVLPGTCALLLFPHVPHPDLVYPMLIVNVLPPGLVGLLVAGFVAATMTSVASMLNSASTLVTMDLVRRHWPSLGNDRTVAIGRMTTGGCLALAVLWAPQIAQLPSLWQYLQSVLAYVVPPVVALFLVGLFWRRASATAANATFALGTLAGVAVFLLNVVLHVTHIHFLYVAPGLFAFDVAILVGTSLRWPAPPSADVDALHWSRATYAADTARRGTTPMWRDYRFQSIVLLALAACIVIVFR
jgi:solute:Na+ symporter, SSS family